MTGPQQLTPHVWRLPLLGHTLPPYDHTNAYLIVDAGVAFLVDPAYGDQGALDVVGEGLRSAGVRLLKGIILTHTHEDHTGGVEAVRKRFTEAGDEPLPVYVHAGEAARLPDEWRAVVLQGERTLMAGDVEVRCLHTPGHSPGHLALVVAAALDERPEIALVGDLATNTGSVWVGLPEGDVGAYLASLQRLQGVMPRLMGPGHGDPIHKVQRRLQELGEHRLAREREIVAALTEAAEAGTPALSATALTELVYPDLHGKLLEMARLSVLAQLLKLMNEMNVLHLGDDEDGPYSLRK